MNQIPIPDEVHEVLFHEYQRIKKMMDQSDEEFTFEKYLSEILIDEAKYVVHHVRPEQNRTLDPIILDIVNRFPGVNGRQIYEMLTDELVKKK